MSSLQADLPSPRRAVISLIMLSLPVIGCSSDFIASPLHLLPPKLAAAAVPTFSYPVHNLTPQSLPSLSTLQPELQ